MSVVFYHNLGLESGPIFRGQYRYFEANSNGITRYGLGKPSIENLLLPIPPDSEQQQIANFLNRKTKQIGELVVTEHRKIELLKEYRQSLISEAGTGKIDVRNEV